MTTRTAEHGSNSHTEEETRTSVVDSRINAASVEDKDTRAPTADPIARFATNAARPAILL